MQAAVYKEFGGPIRIQTMPKPTAPSGGVVLQTKATGVCRSDWHGWKGHDSDIADHGLPFIPGHEFSGIVVEVGTGVSKFSVGDRVAVPFILSCGNCRECSRGKPTVCEEQEQPGFTFQGSFAQFVAVPRADRNMCKLPENVSFVSAAALGCRFTTAYRAVVQQGRLQAGETVAVFGCGGVGLSVVMIAVAHGARCIAIDPNPATRARALEFGACGAVDAAGNDDAAVQELVRAMCAEHGGGATGADVSVDAAGFKSTCENAVHCARRAGRVIQVGLPINLAPAIPMARVAGWELEIIGSHGCAASDFPLILDLVSRGELRPDLLVEAEVSLEEGARAIEAMDHGSPLGITVVTDFDQPQTETRGVGEEAGPSSVLHSSSHDDDDGTPAAEKRQKLHPEGK